MSNVEGQIIWHELVVADVDAALSFYPPITGWSATKRVVGGAEQAIFEVQSKSIATVVNLSLRAGVPAGAAGWISYALTGDVDKATEKATALGGLVILAAMTTTDVGRFAIIEDPLGASIGLFAPARVEGDSTWQSDQRTGQVGWRELYTTDVDAALDFYSEMFGWKRDQAFEMGPAGTYQTVSVGGQPIGGMMRRPEVVPQNLWSPFIQVADIEDAERRVREHNGSIVDGLRPVPGGNWTVKCTDNQGRMFALSGRKR
ncbi:VOC family protein [Sphingomonas koreensis]|nr:VOC family protein [Sphingomonas koreensis]